MDVLGVDGCRGGWVGALWLDGAPGPVVLAAREFGALVREATRERTGTGGLQVVGVDIPIGLPDAGPREADRLARQALPGRAASVFSTLVRPAYEAPHYAAARSVAVERTGRSASAQAFALGRKILEVDTWLRRQPRSQVVEVHPEVSFAALNGEEPIPAGKKTPAGMTARRALEAEGMRVPDLPRAARGRRGRPARRLCRGTGARDGSLAEPARCPTRQRSSATASPPRSGSDVGPAPTARAGRAGCAARHAPARTTRRSCAD